MFRKEGFLKVLDTKLSFPLSNIQFLSNKILHFTCNEAQIPCADVCAEP